MTGKEKYREMKRQESIGGRERNKGL